MIHTQTALHLTDTTLSQYLVYCITHQTRAIRIGAATPQSRFWPSIKVEVYTTCARFNLQL